MKRLLIVSGIVLCLGLGLLFAYNATPTYVPIIVERQTLESSVASVPSQALKNPGKIFIRGSHLYVVEQYYGVHVYDNSNPAQPQKLGFIRILGCTDVAVRANTMYASSAVDMVTIDIANLQAVKETSRERNVLSELVSPLGFIPDDYSRANRPVNTIIIAWRKK
jgi:hypothetical protein